MELKIKRVRPDAHLPGRATPGAAGFDLRACCPADILVPPAARALVPTGISIELPGPQYAAMLYARSGLAYKQGLALANGVGVIDADYRGEVMVAVVNLSDKEIRITHGERVAQMVIQPVCIPDMLELDDLTETDRGAGGFGSTGTK